jgi:hypothetical protein
LIDLAGRPEAPGIMADIIFGVERAEPFVLTQIETPLDVQNAVFDAYGHVSLIHVWHFQG